jgi:hypothetical protein
VSIASASSASLAAQTIPIDFPPLLNALIDLLRSKQLDGGEFESTIVFLKADCPLEDGQWEIPVSTA